VGAGVHGNRRGAAAGRHPRQSPATRRDPRGARRKRGREGEAERAAEGTKARVVRDSGASIMNVTWKGVFPAATTQFHNDQSLDLAGTTQHVERLLRAGVHGMIMLGTVGENCSLEYREKLDVLRATVEQVRRRVPVLSGVAECSTALACRFAADAKKAGVD